ncbi:MAG: rod shape-determining protein RodA [Oscillospiraceae bacterium]|nr:rod shape-determining protein RodA [Oscillospiraceae bacterium]
MNKKSNFLEAAEGFDWALLAVTLFTAVFGVVSIYSATRSMETMSNVYVQGASLVIGLAVLTAAALFDYEQLTVLVPYIYCASVLTLILVLIPGIGYADNWGARSWIRFNSAIGFQPAEIAKIGFIITFACHLERSEEKINKPLTLLGLVLHLGILVGLIMLQPDAGSSMVFAFIFFCMIFVANLSYKYILPVLAAGIMSLPVIYFFVLSPYQKDRIDVFFNPESQPLAGGYNVIQSKIAVGSGMLTGKGFLRGTQNQMKLLPTKHTDFIYSVISEEWGFIGSVFIILLLFFIIYRCFRTAENTGTPFGKYICTGIGAMFLFHTVENIGMCIGLTPVTGIPLPLVSYGGTSLITNLAAIGLVLSVYLHSNNSMFSNY